MTRRTPPTICYYVTGHGLGHASRAAQVMARLPADHRLVVKSFAPEWFFRLEAARPLEYVRERFDVGAVQRGNFAVDWDATVAEGERVMAEAEARVEDEARFLRAANARAVVCDVPALPLRAAKLAGIPSVVVGNFTWVEILRARGRRDPRAAVLARRHLADYRLATLALRTPLSFPMGYFPRLVDIPLIARRGRGVRAALRRELRVPPCGRIVLVYTGIWDDGGLRHDRLAAIPGVTFVSFRPAPPPVVTLDGSRWGFADVLASADAVVAKPGYGMLGECMANGVPVVYHPRPEFSEYHVLRRALDAWGGGVRIGTGDLLAGRWRAALDRAFALSPSRLDAGGARAAAREIMRLADGCAGSPARP